MYLNRTALLTFKKQVLVCLGILIDKSEQRELIAVTGLG